MKDVARDIKRWEETRKEIVFNHIWNGLIKSINFMLSNKMPNTFFIELDYLKAPI